MTLYADHLAARIGEYGSGQGEIANNELARRVPDGIRERRACGSAHHVTTTSRSRSPSTSGRWCSSIRPGSVTSKGDLGRDLRRCKGRAPSCSSRMRRKVPAAVHATVGISLPMSGTLRSHFRRSGPGKGDGCRRTTIDDFGREQQSANAIRSLPVPEPDVAEHRPSHRAVTHMLACIPLAR